MKRKLIDRLILWKEKNSSIPLYITGARGVGKTYLALEFAKDYYDIAMYLNFETDPLINHKFKNFDGDDLVREIYRYNQRNEKASFLSLPFHDKSTLVEYIEQSKCDANHISDQQTVLILDEISYCDDLDRILRAVIQSRRPIHIILLSSYLFVPTCIKNKTIELISYRCYPLDFEEFLMATGNEWYIGVINLHFDSNQAVPEIVHKELLELYEIYLLVGGMPETISEYLNFSNINQIAEKHRIHCGTFSKDIYAWQSSSDAFKMNQVMDTIPLQLLKKNKKFQYTYIRKGATKAMYESAINTLQTCCYVIASKKITEESQLKLYFYDTGILSYLIRNIAVQKGSLSYEQMKSALIENSIAQEFYEKDYHLRFWESDSSAKVEFLIGQNDLLPVEVFLDDKTRSKNLSVLKDSYHFDYAVKISSRNFGYSNHIKYIPYYAIYCL